MPRLSGGGKVASWDGIIKNYLRRHLTKLREMREGATWASGTKSIPDRGDSKYKGPEAEGPCLEC